MYIFSLAMHGSNCILPGLKVGPLLPYRIATPTITDTHNNFQYILNLSQMHVYVCYPVGRLYYMCLYTGRTMLTITTNSQTASSA